MVVAGPFASGTVGTCISGEPTTGVALDGASFAGEGLGSPIGLVATWSVDSTVACTWLVTEDGFA